MVYAFSVKGISIDIDLDSNKAMVKCPNGRLIERPLTFVKVSASEQDGGLAVLPLFTIADWINFITEVESNK